MIDNNRKIFFFPLFSITLFIFGTSLIIFSIMSIILSKDYFNDQKNVKQTTRLNKHIQKAPSILEGNFNNKKINIFTPKFVFRDDLSIKGLSLNSVLDKNNKKINQSTDQSIKLNNFDLKKVALNEKILDPDLKKLPKNLHLNDVKTKKDKFISSILPVVVKVNEKIRANRYKLLEIKDFLVIQKTLNKKDQNFLEQLASQYNINTHNKHKIDTIESLLILVDEIPNSIVIAQAANESGWGTSRFAKEFNALFGEYTFNINNGIAPAFRNDGEKHLIKFFSTVNESIRSYFYNLNTHSAYKEFRIARKQFRKFNLKLDPMVLVEHLNLYARDKDYVKNIKSIIKTNYLTQFDDLKVVTTKS